MSMADHEVRKSDTKGSRTQNINIRVTPDLRALIDRAAAAEGKSRSEFMLESAQVRARDVLLDQTLFTFDPKSYEEFLRILDNPPPPGDKLRALLRKKAPWET